MQNDAVIIYFDGVCHLCNGFVDWVITRDQHQKFRFAPLQGETAAAFLPAEQRQNLQSLVVTKGGLQLQKSTAVLEILRELPFWKWTQILRLLPRSLRDLIYDFVARHRYTWFGRRELCRLPTAAEKGRLLP